MKVLLWLVGVVAVVAFLFIVVFPWFNARFVTDPVLEGGAPAATAVATAPAPADSTPAPTPAATEPTPTDAATPFQPSPLGEVTEY